jgi:hypothetical protein
MTKISNVVHAFGPRKKGGCFERRPAFSEEPIHRHLKLDDEQFNRISEEASMQNVHDFYDLKQLHLPHFLTQILLGVRRARSHSQSGYPVCQRNL